MKEDYNRFSPTQVLTEKQVPEDAIKIFYSYSRKDLDMRNALEDHLSTLREAGKISTWHDLELEAGTEWEPAILHKLDTADIILLLISSSFIASKYCYGTELKQAIARHNAGTARVIPIILRPCDWNHSYVPFSKLNVLPTHAKPITQWEDRDAAFAIVAQRIRETVDQLNAQKLAEHQAEEEKQRQAAQLKRDTEAANLMPQHDSLTDIATLKNDAYRAERKQNWELAEQLWLQVLAAASGQDMEAIEALQNLGVQRHTKITLPQTESSEASKSSKATPNPTTAQIFNLAGDHQTISASTQSPIPIRPQMGRIRRSASNYQALIIPVFLLAAIIGLSLAYFSQFLGNQSPRPSPSPTSDIPSKASPANPSPSSTAVDYSRLEVFLKAGRWKDADKETFNLIFKVAKREKEGWLDETSQQKFPCDVLNKIDRLWVDSSSGKFGFSVQKKIYLEPCGGKSDGPYDDKAWNCFADRVGWRVNNEWIKNDSDLVFNIQAPSGHLPRSLVEIVGGMEGGGRVFSCRSL